METAESADLPPFLEMDPARDTSEYRGRANMFFKDAYGLDLSQPNDKAKLIANSINPKIKVIMDSIYAPQIKEANFPTSNVRVLIDYYRIEVADQNGIDITGGKKLTPSDLALYGEMRFVDESGTELIPKVIFHNGAPLHLDAASETAPLAFDLESVPWGKGLALGAFHRTEDQDKHKTLVMALKNAFPGTLGNLKKKAPAAAEKRKKVKV